MFRRGCIVAAAVVGIPAVQAPDVSTREVVAAAAAYVRTYQQQLTSVVAAEVYTQEIVHQVPRAPDMPRRRTLSSEVFFMFAPVGDGWMAIRDVIEVDTRRVGERVDVVRELQRLAATDVARAMKTHNSRFNIGRTYRNFNEPTLSLLVLDDEHRRRFSFRVARVEQTAEGPLATLSFTEKERPTLIRDVKYGAVFSRGELLVEAASGRIRHARLTASIGPTKLDLTTEYAPDPRLGLWVPARFRERYEHGRPPRSFDSEGQYEELACEATYTDYRRFETSVRIK